MTIGLSNIIAIIFGNAISPLKISARDHTSLDDITEPIGITPTKKVIYITL